MLMKSKDFKVSLLKTFDIVHNIFMPQNPGHLAAEASTGFHDKVATVLFKPNFFVR